MPPRPWPRCAGARPRRSRRRPWRRRSSPAAPGGRCPPRSRSRAMPPGPGPGRRSRPRAPGRSLAGRASPACRARPGRRYPAGRPRRERCRRSRPRRGRPGRPPRARRGRPWRRRRARPVPAATQGAAGEAREAAQDVATPALVAGLRAVAGLLPAAGGAAAAQRLADRLGEAAESAATCRRIDLTRGRLAAGLGRVAAAGTPEPAQYLAQGAARRAQAALARGVPEPVHARAAHAALQQAA